MSVGYQSGYLVQRERAIALGNQAGYNLQGTGAIAIGTTSGYTNQGSGAIAIGDGAGYTTQGVSTTVESWQNPFGSGLNNNCYSILIVGNILYVGGVLQL